MKVVLEWTGDEDALREAFNMLGGALTLAEDDDEVMDDAADLGGVGSSDRAATLVLSRIIVERLCGRDFPCDDGEGEGGDLTVKFLDDEQAS